MNILLTQKRETFKETELTFEQEFNSSFTSFKIRIHSSESYLWTVGNFYTLTLPVPVIV